MQQQWPQIINKVILKFYRSNLGSLSDHDQPFQNNSETVFDDSGT